jgi:NO-binding membrane sensor protein with MHYT domain
MAPFNTPWSTFFAWIVTGLSIIIAVVWAFIDFKLSKRKTDNRK